MDFTRRQWIIGTGSAIALLGSACSMFRTRSEIDQVADELDDRLRQLSGPDMNERLAIAEDIRRQATALLESHDTFANEFNRRAVDRDVSAEELYQRVSDYEIERKALRKKLLQSQDRLHAVVPEGEWPQILDLLNRKGETVASARGTVG